MLVYDDANILPFWVLLDNKQGNIKELNIEKENDRNQIVPTSRQAAIQTKHQDICDGDSQSSPCNVCKRVFPNLLEMKVCAKCQLSVHALCLHPPAIIATATATGNDSIISDESAPITLSSSTNGQFSYNNNQSNNDDVWLCNECITCVGCGLEKKYNDVSLKETPSGFHQLCKTCLKKFVRKDHCPKCLKFWDVSPNKPNNTLLKNTGQPPTPSLIPFQLTACPLVVVVVAV